MVGGAKGSFIGPIHRMAVRMDDLADLRTAPSYDLFLRHYLAFAAPVHTGHTELAQSYAGQKTVQQMPLYPREGSVKVLDGALVVKLNEAS